MREATPSTPVRFLGLKNAPVVGDILTITNDPKVLKRKQKKSYQSFGYMKHKTEIAKTGIQLPIILKADTLHYSRRRSGRKLHFKDVEVDMIRRFG